MPRLYFKGENDTHITGAAGRLVVFTRNDDGPLPYAEVSLAEAKTLTEQAAGLYALAWADAVGDDEPEADAPKPVRRGKRVTG